jgi:acetate kinase
LTLNLGSSSLKFAIFQGKNSDIHPERLVSGKIDRIGLASGTFQAKDSHGSSLAKREITLNDHDHALETLLEWISSNIPATKPQIAGHRIVHGGNRYAEPQLVNSALLAYLKDLIPLAPDHLPQEIQAIETLQRLQPGLPQAACFDTAFHRTMPRVAQLYGLPRAFADEGIIRYGFHGLSYEYIVQALAREAGELVARGHVIVAHLGNGCSLCAIREGQSVETTMGFTPTGGLTMSTRSGDLDPSVIVYLLEHKKRSPAEVNEILNKRSGLLGLSGLSSDMHDLLQKAPGDPRAEEAIAVFCYGAKKFLGALTAALGGLQTLIFTGGIGENAAPIRERICAGLEDFGIRLDSNANNRNEAVISSADARVIVRVMPTDEEAMIARHTLEVWQQS